MISRRAPWKHTQHAKQKETTFLYVGVGVYHLGLCYPWARGGETGERSEFRNEQQEETTTQEENREGSTMSAAKTPPRHRALASALDGRSPCRPITRCFQRKISPDLPPSSVEPPVGGLIPHSLKPSRKRSQRNSSMWLETYDSARVSRCRPH